MFNKIMAFANQKGGVGKTTSCVNIAAALVGMEYKILVIDLDPQGNATMGSGINKNQIRSTINEVLQNEVNVREAIISQTSGGYDLLPANGDLTAAEVALLRKPEQEKKLKEVLLSLHAHYQWIMIDCPPSLNMLTLNALVAADSVLIPMQCEYYALEGLSALMGTIGQIQNSLNPKLVIEGIIRTMYDPRNRLSTEVSAQLISHFGNKIYQTVIPRNVKLAEAPSHGMPISLYDASSKGAEAYMALAREILKQNNEQSIQTRDRVLETTA